MRLGLPATFALVAASRAGTVTAPGVEIVVTGSSAAVPDGIYDSLEACSNRKIARVARRNRYATATTDAKA